MTEDRIRDFLSPRVPFGVASGKNTSKMFTKNFLSKPSIDKFSSPRISQDETGLETNHRATNLNGPVIRGMGVAQSARRNFVIPGSITLDTDSEVDTSKLQIRQ